MIQKNIGLPKTYFSSELLFFWVYYNSIAFILSGEIAQVATMIRAWKSRPVAQGEV